MSASSSRRLAAILALGATGCVGPWNDLPSDNPVQVRASVAVFVQPGDYTIATFTRPLDIGSEKGVNVPWIDPTNTLFRIEENSPSCNDSLPGRKSTSIGLPYLSTNPDWSYTASSVNASPSCGKNRTWRFRGHIRWNASSPFSLAAPLWVTDSVDTWGETSTAPVFLHGNLSAPLELRWSTLAQADSNSRIDWSRSPQTLELLVESWKTLQIARGLDTRVLALDITTKPMAWRWSELDTGLLHKTLVASTRYGTGYGMVQIVFSAGDSIWLPTDHSTWIQPLATGIGAKDFYAAMHMRRQYTSSIADVSPPFWPNSANWLSLVTSNRRNSDTAQVWFWLPWNSRNPGRVELAVAGTCPGQRDYLRLGGSNRQQLPHGNAAPMDGFVCEVLTDTISFPLGQ